MVWFFVFMQTTADVMRISDCSSVVCSSDLGGFGVENDLAHHTSLFRAAPGRQALRRRSPPVRNSLTMPASWRKLCRLPRPVCTTKRSEEHTSELQSLMRISYAVFCLKKKTPT